MKMKTATIQSPTTGQVHRINVAGNIDHWKRGKCWSVFCLNPLWFVHISKKGIASHGYCHGCAEAHVFRQIVDGLPKERGDWYSVENDLIKYAVDKSGSFTRVKPRKTFNTHELSRVNDRSKSNL